MITEQKLREALAEVTQLLKDGDTLGASLGLVEVEKLIDAIAQAPEQQAPQGWNGRCPGEDMPCEARDVCAEAGCCMRNDEDLPAAPEAAKPLFADLIAATPRAEVMLKAAALLAADSKAGGEPVAFGNRDELDNMLHDRSATVVGRRDGQHQVPLFGHPPAADGNAQPVAWLDRKQLAELQHCNGMSVWAESPGIYHPDPSAMGVKAPSTLVAVYTRPQQQAKPLTEEMGRQMKERCDSYEMRGAFADGWMSAERAHGIGKDQA